MVGINLASPFKTTIAAVIATAAVTAPVSALADSSRFARGPLYEVTITNLTKGPVPAGQVFSPPLIATHRSTVSIFKAGDAALDELADLAENGRAAPLAELLETIPAVRNVVVAAGPVPPGQSATYQIRARRSTDRISVVSMLVNTNDAFLGLNTVALPRFRSQAATYDVVAYDAGTEANNELCTAIPGPACGGGMDRATEDAEGFIYISNGVHGIGDLDPAANDWRNPVARVSVRRLR